MVQSAPSKHGAFGLLGRATFIPLFAGAGASLALMLRAGRHQNSRVLVLLFGIWVLSPFVSGVWAYFFSKHWPVAGRALLYVVMLAITAGSVSIYAAVTFGYVRAKVGFVFLVTPLASWLVFAMAVGIAAIASRRQFGGGGPAR